MELKARTSLVPGRQTDRIHHPGTFCSCILGHIAIAPQVGIAGIDYDFALQLGGIVVAYLRQRRIGHGNDHHV